MPVQVYQPRAKQQEAPAKDPLDQILKGLNIAAGVFGIKEAYDKGQALKQSREESAAQQPSIIEQQKQAAEMGSLNLARAKAGGLTEAEKISLGKDFIPSSVQTPGSIKFMLQNQGGNYEPVYFQPRPKEKMVDEYANELKAIRLQEAKAGKSLPAAQAEALGDANASYQALESSNQAFKKNAGISGPIQGVISNFLARGETGETGRAAKAFNAQLKLNAQSIGKYLEGGKLTDADIDRYKEMLPNIYDSPEIAQNKTQLLQELISRKQQGQVESLGQAGYNVKNIKISQSPSLISKKEQPTFGLADYLQPKANAAQMLPKGFVQGGYEYQGGDPKQPASWKQK